MPDFIEMNALSRAPFRNPPLSPHQQAVGAQLGIAQ
jgi:hypothetical protein